MPVVQPATSSFTVEQVNLSTVMAIPSPRRWQPLLFSFVQTSLLAGMTVFMVIFVLRSVRNGGLLFFALFGIAWIVAFSSNLLALAWDLVGKEVLEVSRHSIVIRRLLLGLKDEKEYLAEHIVDVRISNWNRPYDNRVKTFLFKFSTMSDNPLAFDYGAKTIRFGNNLDEAEARQIVALVHRRFPQYAERAQ